MRKLVLGAPSIALAGSLPPTWAVAHVVDEPAIEWQHSVWGKRCACTEGTEKVAAPLKERTGGKFTINIAYGEMFSKDKENLDSIK